MLLSSFIARSAVVFSAVILLASGADDVLVASNSAESLMNLPDDMLNVIGQRLPYRDAYQLLLTNTRLKCLLERAASYWREALFDPRTQDRFLPSLIGAYTDRLPINSGSGHAENGIDYAEAVFLYDRITNGKMSETDKTELLKQLLNRFNTKVFFSVIGANFSQVRAPTHAKTFDSISLLKLISDIQGLDYQKAFQELPHDVIEVVKISIDHVTNTAMESSLPPDIITQVRSMYPAPFNKVFPYNREVASRLAFDMYRKSVVQGSMLSPSLENIQSLMELGLRFDWTAMNWIKLVWFIRKQARKF